MRLVWLTEYTSNLDPNTTVKVGVGVGTLLRDYTRVSSTDREHYLDDLNGMGDTSNGDYCGGKYMIIMVIAIMNP